ncbi:MAG: biotin/lipoyl-binding protein [Planctomycetaceae bacterium]|nr:biotin/lipoyl-binding protein [Planctomycetaceae bacterium]
MSLHSQLGIDDLPGILDQAIAHRESHGHSASLIQVFTDELRQAASAECIRVLEVTAGRIQLVGQSGNTHEPLLADEEIVALAAGAGTASRPTANSRNASCRIATAEISRQITIVLEIRIARLHQDFCDAVADVLADLRRRQLLTELHEMREQRAPLDQLILMLHNRPEEQKIANILATDAAAVLGCSRVSVCSRRGSGKWHLVAATGVHSPNERADAVRRICHQIAATANSSGDSDAKSFRAPPDQQTNPEAITAASSVAAVSASDKKRQLALPLDPKGDWQTCRRAVLLEWDSADKADAGAVRIICHHAILALDNSDRGRQTLISRWLHPDSGIRRLRLVASLLAPVVIGLLLVFWPMELKIEAAGILQPAQRTHIYAPESGIVTNVDITDGDEVSSGDPILQLRNDELSLQLETVLGDLASAQARLAAIESLRIGGDASRNPLLQTEQAEVKARIESLEKQRILLDARLRQLPLVVDTGGRVFGPDLRERFQGRPIVRGQYLCEIADLNQPWELRLQVPETEIRHLLHATQVGDPHPAITYSLATTPDQTDRVHLTRICQTTELDSFGNLTTTIIAQLDPGQANSERPGTGVIGYIHCGRRSAGYVCFRKLIDIVRRKILL